MKRALIALLATVAGVAWILGYKVEPHTVGIVSAGSGATGGGPVAGVPVPAPSAPGSGGVSGTFTGADVPNRFGDVQVRVVISNGRITDLQAVQLPADRSRSAYISQVAGPMLRTEVLQAQSARIDIVSGATYTSQSYAQSVESALQQAHLG
ncbi:MAG: FMN-binding protein [Candidatus Dormibacteraeota bacterium]|nr:FMN-binding protein [Candidatus Dormibacteraeota bacterium]